MLSKRITGYSFEPFAQSLMPFAVKKILVLSKTIFIVFLLFKSLTISAQKTNISEVIISTAEELAASETDQEAAAVYTDRLYELAENPVRINSASEEEISRLFFLSDFQIKALADYTLSTGNIVSFNELALIPGFDRPTAELLIPFITLEDKDLIPDDSIKFRSSLLTNLSVRTGRKDTTSLGSAWRVLTKYKFSAGSFSGGFTFEKDPGEKMFCPGTLSPDFFSASLAYTGKGIVRRIIVGDYAARFAQGLNINTSVSTGLSLTSQGYMSVSGEIKPYTSTDENSYFRGIAAVLAYKNLEISLLGSKNNLDATISASPGSSEDYIGSFYRSGTHNTINLLAKKDAVSESFYAASLTCNFQNIKLGMVYSQNSFSLPVKAEETAPEKLFAFSGRSANVCSFYYSSMIKRIMLYGEFSANDIRRYAVVQGLSFRPSDRLSVNFLFRKYNPGYASFHGKGPGNSTVSYPEQSITGNFTFEAASHLFVSGGCSIQQYPWLKYRTSSPSTGVKREMRVKYLPAEKFSFDLLYSYRMSMADNSAIAGVPELRQMISRSLKFSFRYSLSGNLTLGTRLDYKLADSGRSKGVSLMEDLNYRVRSVPLTFWIRYCVFRTDDYDSRIYTWENDLIYSFSIPALYGKGSRFYFMAGWKISSKAELRFKYAILSDSDTSGTPGDSEEFRLQLRLAI
jgi:hypothetical protein